MLKNCFFIKFLFNCVFKNYFVCAYAIPCMWRSGDSCLDPRDRTQALRIVGKHLYLPRYQLKAFAFSDRVSCIPGQPKISHVAEDGLDFLILLILLPGAKVIGMSHACLLTSWEVFCVFCLPYNNAEDTLDLRNTEES